MKFSSLKDIDKNAIKPGSLRHVLMQLEAAGVGKITKQNTTVDVKPGETKRQAAKFGNTVDKNGVPPTLSKKVKGSKTNVAFNLGMVKESKDLAQTSEIFVDMDGVLADFFGEWQKLIGKGWRDVEGDALQPALQAIRDKDDFWLSLPMTSNAKGLLNLIKDVKGSYNILSAPLAGDKKAEPHKREWIKKNLSFFPPKNVIITSDKQKYATQPDGTPNILIDDFGSNISKWEGAGGVGFKHKDHKFERTAKNIKQYMQQPAKEPVEEGIVDVVKATGELLASPITMAPAVAKAAPLIQKALDTNDPKLFGQAMEIVVNARLFQKHPKILKFYIKLGKKLAQKLAAVNPDMKDFDWEDMKADLKKQTGFDLSQYESVEEGDLIPNPQRSTLVRSDDVYQWYKLGTNMANIKSMAPNIAKRDKPDIFIQFYGGEKEKSYMKKQLKRLGYDIQDADGHKDTHYDEDSNDTYTLYISNFFENFADGKKKGKSRPGRVKRSGASCNGSVTSLRKRAKASSGEKAKMYHWCANMKSGRKKK